MEKEGKDGQVEECQGGRKDRLLYIDWLVCNQRDAVFLATGSSMDTEGCSHSSGWALYLHESGKAPQTGSQPG